MKLLHRNSSRSNDGSRLSESGIRLSESGSSVNESGRRESESESTLNRSGNNCNESRSRLNSSGSSLNDSGSGLYDSGSPNCITVVHPGEVAIHIYNEDLEGAKEMFSETDTCEDICLSMAHKLGITPTMLNCFGLSLYDVSLKKYYWLAPHQTPGLFCGTSFQRQEQEIHFRMRFVPDQSKCVQLDEVDSNCLTYLVWQIKWDFIHSSLSCLFDELKSDEVRGFSCMLLLLALRMNTERENCPENLKAFMKKTNSNNFLPAPLRRKWIEKNILNKSMYKKVRSLQEERPAEQCSSHYLMRWCLQVILKDNLNFYTETFVAYELDIDNEEFERIDGDDQPSQIVEETELTVTIKMEQSLPKLTVSRKSAKHKHEHIMNCYIESVVKLEITQIELDSCTWWKLQLFRQDGHPEMLYFKDRKEVYSFTTCVECYYRLIHDFYDSLCQEVEPTRVRELNVIRAHGPVRDEYVRKKLKKKKSKDLYVLRMNPIQFGQYDILYLPSSTANLRKETLPKIQHVEGGYIVAGSQDPPQDLKVLVSELIKDTSNVPGTCMRIKPQSEGCDVLQSLLMGQEPRDLLQEAEESKERRRIKNQPKVYCKADLEIQSSIGQGHFTEAYSGLLCGQDEVVVKQLRDHDIPDDTIRIVQKAFFEGLEKLMVLGDLQYFVGCIGMCLVPSVCMMMKGTSYGSLGQFLQYRDQGLPMLSLHHLLDANIQLASALVFMEENDCFHGNLHCDNISVMNYDNRTMVVRITDPGMVSLYNQLPLDNPVNAKRLPWIAPELQNNLTDVTAQSEVFAYGTTLWQMFSHGLNPAKHCTKLRNKQVTEIIEFFSSGNMLSCPPFLQLKNEDPKEIQEVKELLYKVMISCWKLDPQERANPKQILRDLNSNVQTYEETYHKYNIIPYFDVASSSASYPIASSSEGTRLQSSQFIDSDQPILVPDITCLKQDRRRPLDNSEGSSRNLVVARELPGDNQPALSKENKGLVAMATRRSQGPLEPSGSQAQAQIGPRRGFPTRPISELPALPTHNIEESRLEIDRRAELGKGHYGAVYKGKLHPSDAMKALTPDAGPETIVIKVLKPDMVAKYSEDFKKEAQVMQTLSHKNVVKFYGISRQGEYLVMEFVEKNSLHKYVSMCDKNGKTITLQTFIQLAVDIASGMEYLESQRVIHCDLAARNILLARNLCAKISDFGLSKILSQEKDYYRRTADKTIPILWCAPEWIGYKRFTSKSDVWSFGVVLWEMFSYGKPPLIIKDHISIHKILEFLNKNERLKQPTNCPKQVYDEMLNCWKWDPTHRPDFSNLKIRFQDPSLVAEAAVKVPSVPVFRQVPVTVTESRPAPAPIQVSSPAPSSVTLSSPGPRSVAVQQPGLSTTGNDTTQNLTRQIHTNIFSCQNKTLVETNRNGDNNTNEIHQEETNRKEALSNGFVELTNVENTLPKTISDQEERNQPPLIASAGKKCVSKLNQDDIPGDLKVEKNTSLNQSIRNVSKENETIRKEVLEPVDTQNTNSVEVTNQTGFSEDKDTGPNQSKFVSKQVSAGLQQSMEKDSKVGDHNILIQKNDLLINRKVLLGKGSFGAVYRGMYKGEEVAVKECTDSKQYERFSREFHLLYKLKGKSTNIVHFIGLYEKGDTGLKKEHMYVMEYLEGGALWNYLDTRKKEGKPVDALTKINFLIDIAKGMDYLFQGSIVHCDLTAKNILLSKDHLTAKISDFGWAKQLESTEDNVQYKRKDIILQPFWAAPEVFQKEIYTKFSDIWSYGVVCIEVFQDAATPYLDIPLVKLTGDGEQYYVKFYRAILNGQKFPRPPLCPEQIYNDVIRKCWELEYSARIQFGSIIEELTRYTSSIRSEGGSTQSQ